MVPTQISELEPALTKMTHGCFFREEGQIDNQSVLLSLERFLQTKINFQKRCRADCIEPRKIISGNNVYHFDWVFDCRGLGAK